MIIFSGTNISPTTKALKVLFIFLFYFLFINENQAQQHNRNQNSDCMLLAKRCSRGEGCSVCYACANNKEIQRQSKRDEDDRLQKERLMQEKEIQKRKEEETKRIREENARQQKLEDSKVQKLTLGASNSNGSVNSQNNRQGNKINTNTTPNNASSTYSIPSTDAQMRNLGIDPNEDYMGSAISMAGNLFGDLFREAREKKMRKEREKERIINEYKQQINNNLTAAQKDNIKAIKLVGYAYWFLENYEQARFWFMRLLELKDNSGYVAMAELENSILSNGVVYRTLSKAEQKVQLDIVLKWYEKGTDVGDERSFIVLIIYALGLQIYNEDIYYKMINSKDDRWQLDWQYDIIKPVKPWKKLKNLEHAYALAKKAESFGLIKPIKIVSNYSQFYDNKIRNNFYNKAVKLHELKLYNAEYISLLTMAAEKYYVAAINDLGVAYFRGSSVSKQDIIAYKYFKLGAELGNETAMENLSMMYARGVLKDDRKSFYIKPDYKRTKYWKEQAEKAKSESKW